MVGRVVAPRRKSFSIYEAYPLTLRAYLSPSPPPFERALSQQRLASDDTMAARRLHELLDDATTASPGAARESATCQRQRAERRSANMCSRFGKFTGEVYETKERSHMINVLKRRSRTPAESGASKFTADDVLRAGTLTKQGSWRRNWKTRFFLLRQDVPSLSYYKSEEKLELLGAIAITGDTLVLDKSAHGHAPYRFQLRTDAAALLLETETRDNMQRWMDACQQLVDALRAEKFRQSTVFADRDPTTAARRAGRPSGGAALRHSVATTAASSTSSSILKVRTPGRIGAEDMTDFLDGSSDSSSDEEDGGADDEDEDDEEEEDNQKEEEEELWSTGRTQFLVVLDEKTTLQNQHQVQQTKLQRRASAPALPAKRPSAFDLVLELAVGRQSKLLSRSELAGDKLRCLVKVVGYNSTTKATVELGTTDAVRIAPAAAAQQAVDGSPIRVTFSVVLPAELARFDQLRFTLYRTTAAASGRTTVGLGRCFIDDNLTTLGAPRIVALAEKSSSFHDLLSTKTTEPPPSLRVAPAKGGSSVSLVPLDSSAVHIVVQAFPAVALQTVLPTSGVDMAAAKYLLPTTLAAEDDATALHDNNVMMQVFVENGSFLASSSESSGQTHARLIVVDEILRAPRSTFALPLAFLDFLEETALERVRVLQKQVDADGDKETATLTTVELEFYRKKLEECLRQRQFLMKQEKRLLEEASDAKVFAHAAEQVLAMSVKTKSRTDAVSDAPNGAAASELVAPFKRSTYKSLDLWQLLPTNMQDQFLCVHQPQSPTQFVWHTMTMGCPAAHTKGFANGGFPSTASVVDASRASHSASGYSDDDALTASDNEIERASLLGTQLGRRSRTSNSSSNPASDGVDSVSALRSRLELKERLDIIASQTLSAAVACILASLDLAVVGSETHRLQLANATRFGFLIHFESLLSTQGKEVGMIEDFAAGAKWLRNVFVQFRRHNPKNSVSGQYFSVKSYSPPERRGVAGGTGVDGAYNPSASAIRDTSPPPAYVLVTMGVTDAQLEVLPPLLASGKPFRMRCVLFTQGVNEKQSLVHALKSQTVKVQDRINRENLEELKEIYNIFRRVHGSDSDHRISKIHSDARGDNCISRYNLETLDDLLSQIEQHVCGSSNQFKKNVALLMDTSDFCRELGGARVTCCKSGKDRTAMSVTLEQARLCVSRLRVAQSHGKKLCATMRLFGVRRKNVFLNTKSSKFAFNEMQRKMLPDCYKPPVGTYKSGKT